MLNAHAAPFVPRQTTEAPKALPLRFAPGQRVLVYLASNTAPRVELVPWAATVQDVAANQKRMTVLYDEAAGMSPGHTQDLLLSRYKVILAESEPMVMSNVLETNRHYIEKRTNPEPLLPWEEMGLWEGGQAW